MPPFASCLEKFRRAERHLDELERCIDAFLRTGPFPFVIEGDHRFGVTTITFGEPEPLPGDLPLILGDAVHNARTALDHFAYQSVANPNRNTAFPIHRRGTANGAKPFAERVESLMKGASPALRDAVVSCGLHEGGSAEYAWALDYLDIMDKHRLLVPVVMVDQGMTFSLGGRREVTESPWAGAPVEAGRKLMFAVGSADPSPDTEFTFQITLAEPAPLLGQPAVPALRRLVDDSKGLLQRLIPLA